MATRGRGNKHAIKKQGVIKRVCTADAMYGGPKRTNCHAGARVVVAFLGKEESYNL